MRRQIIVSLLFVAGEHSYIQGLWNIELEAHHMLMLMQNSVLIIMPLCMACNAGRKVRTYVKCGLPVLHASLLNFALQIKGLVVT